jgi:predicted PurR-regulated permease PerM
MTKERTSLVFLLILVGIALFFCYLLVAPFLKPIIFSIVLAVLAYPLHARIHYRIRNRNLAALSSTTVVVVFLTSASIFLAQAVVSGLRDIYESLSTSGDTRERLALYVIQLSERAVELAGRYIPIAIPNLRTAIVNQAEKAVAGLLAWSAGAIGSVTTLLVDAAIAFFILFFFLRDGRNLLRRLAVILPLPSLQVSRLFACVKTTLNAIVFGTLAIAAIQGVLAGLAFWALGLASAALWGVVTALCALLPVIGTTFVLLPAISMLLFSGHWIKGVILLVWAVVVIHPVDNILRPYLIGERVKLSTLYVFFALLGGLRAFGALGIFVGPLILALTVALFTFLREQKVVKT